MATLSAILAALNTTTHYNGTNHNGTVHNSTAASNITVPLAFNQPLININSNLQYQVGDMVNVSWQSPYAHTTVEVWQGPSKDGVFAVQTVAANFTQNYTMVLWEAGPIGNASLDEGFHFRLQKGHTPNTCLRCIANGPTFHVAKHQEPAQTASSSSTANPTATAVSLSESSKLAIGLGVGLGIGFILAVVGCAFLFLKRREKQRQQERERDEAARLVKQEQMRYSSGGDSWATRSSGLPVSYHSRFEFEGPDGTPREGWESLWHRIFGR